MGLLDWYLLVMLSLTAPSRMGAETTAATVLRGLHQLAADLLATDEQVLEITPTFELDMKQRRYARRPCYENVNEFDDSLPYTKVLRRLLCVEAYQRPASGVPSQISARLADRIDELSLNFINKILSSADKQFSNSYDADAGEIFTAAEKELDSLAGGLENSEEVVLAAVLYPVEIHTEPPNGLVRLMNRLTYRQCTELSLCGRNWPWREIVQSRVSLVGRYRYMVEWGDGAYTQGDIEVTSTERIIIKRPPVP